MARYAIIANGVVENVVEAAAGYTVQGKTVILSETANIGWTWDGTALHPPAPGPAPVPQVITRRQLLIQLQRAGWITADEAVAAAATGALPALLATVVDAMSSDELKAEARITWAAMSRAERADPLLAAAAAAAGASSDDLDDFFRAAAVI